MPTPFKDSSLECGICLCPFDEENERIITLSCGHKWHYDCIAEQLEHAQPSASKRLVFTGCRCAKCGEVCEHEDLRHLTRSTDELREKVENLIREQLCGGASSKEDANPSLMDFGYRTLAFYQCSFCKDPYFGGTIECADTEEGELRPDERLCPKCTPKTQTVCQDPSAHRASHVWKCRFCCQVANHVCYGSVHFCSDCHERNNERVLRSGERGRMIKPKPCPGRPTCPFPFAEGYERHCNGEDMSCEQVYYCARCESSAHSFEQLEPGTNNLLQNENGQDGLRNWFPFPREGGRRFQVEESEIPLSATVTTNFVSNFTWCSMGQTIRLRDFATDLSRLRIEFSAKYMARTDCPSLFCLDALLLNERRQLLKHETTGILDAPADGWERTRLVLTLTADTAIAMIIVRGKDKLFWRGNYGSKVADCSVRLLGNEDGLREIRGGVHPLAEDENYRLEERREREEGGGGLLRRYVSPMMVPLIAGILLWWLMTPKVPCSD